MYCFFSTHGLYRRYVSGVIWCCRSPCKLYFLFICPYVTLTSEWKPRK